MKPCDDQSIKKSTKSLKRKRILIILKWQKEQILIFYEFLTVTEADARFFRVDVVKNTFVSDLTLGSQAYQAAYIRVRRCSATAARSTTGRRSWIICRHPLILFPLFTFNHIYNCVEIYISRETTLQSSRRRIQGEREGECCDPFQRCETM